VRRRDWILLAVLVVIVLIFVIESGVLQRPAPTPGAPLPPSPSPVAEGGPYQIYFSQPVYPDRAESRHGGIDERYVEFVNAATRTLDIADYDFDLENVAQSMAAAKARGVTVRMVTDSDTLNNKDATIQKAFTIVKQAGIPIVGDERQAIMHHKFSVRDGEEIWTGSWNYTAGDTYRLNNNAVRMRSPELSRQYTDEFEQMFVQKKFGGGRVRHDPAPPVIVGSATVQALFAPENTVSQRLNARLGAAANSIHFLAFSFTLDSMGDAMIARHQGGVGVTGVFEKTGSETWFSELGRMKQAGLDVYQDGNPYALHHKVIVIDGKTTVFGSYNFSDSADRDNDENCLIVDDPAFAAKYEEEFQRMLALAKNPVNTKATPEREPPR
jgi:phosphatidylserine/phosphatidylglycerophosphate/cardiolipin synthase-like enzyme